MNLLKYYLFQFWQAVVDHALPLLALLLVALLIPRVGRLIVRVIESRLDEHEESTKARLAVAGALIYVFEAVAFFVLIAAALSNLGVPPLGAAIPATVVSAAVGFGAQSIIADFLAGFFILSEKQFGVGDYVSFDALNGVEGTVVALTLRTTKVRTPSGEVVTIPNSSAGVVTNYSQDWSRAVVDLAVPVHSGETLPDITRRVGEISRKAVTDAAIAADVAGEVEVLPATGLVAPTAAGQPWQVNYRVLVQVNPARQWAVERGIRSALLAEFWGHYNAPTVHVPGVGEVPSDTEPGPTTVFPAAAAGAAVGATAGAYVAETPEEDGAAKSSTEAKDDGPGRPSTATIPLQEEEEEGERRNGIWRADEPQTRWERFLTAGGRVRASTTWLAIGLGLTGLLIFASSNPEDSDASGWLSPAHWREDAPAEATGPESAQPETPSEEATESPAAEATETATEATATTGAEDGSEDTAGTEPGAAPTASEGQPAPQQRPAPSSPEANRAPAPAAPTGDGSSGDGGGATGGGAGIAPEDPAGTADPDGAAASTAPVG